MHQLLGGSDEARIAGLRRGCQRFHGPVGRARVGHSANVRIDSRNNSERSERGIRLLPGWIRARLLRAAEGLPAHVPARLQAGRILSELLLLWLHVPECLLPTVRLSR